MTLASGAKRTAKPLPGWMMPDLTEELKLEVAQMLSLCRDIRQLKPDVEAAHHKPGCGCPWKVDDTGLPDPEQHHVTRWLRETKHVVHDTDYPFFICVRCRNLVPWCYGCDDEDPYLAACCDGCWADLTMEGSNDA